MKYKINSPFVEKVIEIKDESTGFMEDPAELSAYIDENITTIELEEQFSLSGFLSIIEDAALYQDLELDLTYDTAQNIRDSLVGIAALHASVYEMEVNAMMIIYCVAAYLDLLAMNNHDLDFVISEDEEAEDEDPDAWAHIFSLELIARAASVDLPQEALDGMDEPFIIGNSLLINLQNILSAYKTLTGVDLGDFGLMNIEIRFEGPGLEEGKTTLN